MAQNVRKTSAIEEFAPAKVNLALKVHGRRADGYHEIETLIAFTADVGDRLWIETTVAGAHIAPWRAITTSGPYAVRLNGENLIDRARRRVGELRPSLAAAMAGLNVHLEKNLPIAAGLGGGSADAGAALRAIRRLYGTETAGLDWMAIAAELGADVPACFLSAACIARGTGITLEPSGPLPKFSIVLVNANVEPLPRKTPRVFQALGAKPCPAIAPRTFGPWGHDLVGWLSHHGNDLERPSASLMPDVDQVLSALRDFGAPIARLSGAGPTCFALFPENQQAEAGEVAARVKAAHGDWWVATGALDGL